MIDDTPMKAGACCTHKRLPVICWRKVGMTSSPHGPYGLGHTRATMAMTMGSKAVRRSESGKIASVRIEKEFYFYSELGGQTEASKQIYL